ncbi:MAG: hypothetical protein PVJ57_02660 [Phycisphaerae bacterium]|jgi:hypothetical protein
MSFELVESGDFGGGGEALAEGECSLRKGGKLVAHAADLALVNIGNYAMVMADAGTLRIALRAVRDGEEAKSYACSVVRRANKTDSGRREINVLRALHRLNLTPEAVVGRYPLTVKGEGAGGMLIVNLVGDGAKDPEGEKDKGAAKA